MDLTIVIVNWNGGQLLVRCLESIRAYARGVAVVVVDNASTVGSRAAAAAAFPDFRVIDSGGNLGFGRANNLARAFVDTSLVLFLNPDTELMSGALDRAVQCLKEHPDVGILGCRMVNPDGQLQPLGVQLPVSVWSYLFELIFLTGRTRSLFRRWLPLVDPRRSGYVRKLFGGFMMVRREVLDAAGWFDERYFMYAEDVDLSHTVADLGWKLYYCSEAAIVHVGGGVASRVPSAFSLLMQHESIDKMIAKYQGSMAAALYRFIVGLGGMLRFVVGQLARLAAMARRNDLAAAFWTGSCAKQRQMVLWALGLRRATIPGTEPLRAGVRERRVA